MRWIWPLALLAGCGSVDFAHAPVGKFSGEVLVMWVGETTGGKGDGNFVYVPGKDPLRFTRTAADGTQQVIQPALMYTDGGSIPKIGQVFKGFSPWGYAPAYMIHDWLFVASACLAAGDATPEQKALADISFPDSATILAEAVKTLVADGRVAPNDFAGTVISSAVAGPIARNAWGVAGNCSRERISPDDMRQLRRALPDLFPGARTLAVIPGPSAKLVARISF